MGRLLGVQRGGRVLCPLATVCGWSVVDRVDLGSLVLVDDAATRKAGELVTRRVDAVEYLNRQLMEHLAAEHMEHLQQLLAALGGIPGGESQQVSVTMQLHPEAVRAARVDDAQADHAVEHLRRQLAVELTRRQLRPLDLWPAVTVRRLVWAHSVLQPDADGLPGGMAELHPDDPRPPDLFHLELRTLAVPDLRAVVL